MHSDFSLKDDSNKASASVTAVMDMFMLSCLRVRAPFLVFVRAHIDNAVFV